MDKDRAEEIRASVRDKYRQVAEDPAGNISYPVGRESALGLGYDPAWLAKLPEAVLNRFVGAGNPFSVRQPAPGERVLDVGCGCGLDAFIAASLVGAAGRVAGLDMTPAMIDVSRGALAQQDPGNLEFVEAPAEDLPFADDSFDLVISNGVLNLVPDKDRVFRELHRVLRPEGVFAAADLLVIATIPEEVLADTDAWST